MFRDTKGYAHIFQYTTFGYTPYSSKTKLKGDKVDEMVAIADSLATMCRLLTWPTNVSYSVVESRNRIDIDLGGRPVKLHFDAKENLLLSAEVKDRSLGRFGSFEFSDFSWRQGIRFPMVWDYSDDSAKRRGTFQVESMFLLIDLDDSCFTTKGMTKDLQEYIRKAIRSSNMKRLSEVHLTDAQKKEIFDGLAQIQKKIADIEKKYADEPEKLRKASKALMDEWKLHLQEIQTGDKSSVPPQK